MEFSTLNLKKQEDIRFLNIATLIVKVTHRCNLDCAYCYENITKTGQDMSLNTFQDLADKVLLNSRQKEILFLFHGGEPSLISNDWYEQAIHYALTLAKKVGKTAIFSMQSNLLFLNPSKIALYKKYNIHLGISLDGTENHGTMRGGENKVFQNYLKGIEAGLRIGILTTINQANFDKFDQICEFIHLKTSSKSFKANVVSPVGRGLELPSLKAEQVFMAQSSILQYMIKTKGEFIEDNLRTEIIRFFATEDERKNMPSTLCHEKQCGAGTTVLGVTPQGDLLPCGRFQWNDDSYFLGYLQTPDRSKAEKGFQKKLEQFHALVPENWYDCDNCAAKKICGFGCQAFIVRSKTKANVDCLPTKMKYRFFQENKDKLKIVYEKITTPQRHDLNFRIKGENGMIKTYKFPLPKKTTLEKEKNSFFDKIKKALLQYRKAFFIFIV